MRYVRIAPRNGQHVKVVANNNTVISGVARQAYPFATRYANSGFEIPH